MSYLGTPYKSFKYNNTVDTITNQTIGGVKTFTNSPVIPDATASNEPLSKGQLLSAIEQLQENGFFPWQSTKAVGYDIGATVSYNGVDYINTIAGNTATPDSAGSGWNKGWSSSRDTLVASLRANVNISGGGVITWDSNGYFNSTSRFIVIANGRGAFFSTNGYFSISIPTSGTILGVGGASNVTATSAGIPISNWQALYYILPIGSGNVSIASNFRIASYTSDVVIPDNWVLVASRNGDNNTLSIAGGKYTLHQGGSVDTTKYSSAFVPNADLVGELPTDFTSRKATNGYQKLPSGLIIQWGIVPNSIGMDDPYTINYPIAFPNAALLGVAQMISTAVVIDNNSAAWSPVSNSQCSIIKDNNMDTAWIAIGY